MTQRFIGRAHELEALERAWGSNRFEFTVVYERLRVEKTRLIREYITDKPAAYFMALEADDATNLASFSRVFSQFQASTGTGLGGHGRVMARLRICLLTWRIRLLRRRLCWSSMNFRTWWRVVRRFLRCCKSFAIRSGP